MSDAIRGAAQAQQRAVNNLENKHRVEIDAMKKNQAMVVDEMRKNTRADVQNIQDEHAREITEKTLEKEKKLETIRLNLEKTKTLTDSEIKRLYDTNKVKMADNQENYQANLSRIQNQQQESLDENGHRFQVAARNMNDEHTQQSTNTELRYRNQDIKQKQEWDAKINSNRNQFAETYTSEDIKFQQLKNKQEHAQKKDLSTTHQKNESKLSDMNNQHVKKEKMIANENNRSLQDQEKMFEKKYQHQMGRHMEAEKNLDATNNKVVEQSKESLVKRVKIHENHAGDPFFEFTHIKPSVKEELDHYIVKMKVPEYAKEEILVSTNGREIVLTSNRRHKEERTDEDGSKMKVDKVESTVNRIPVGSILHAKKMEKSWADGEMTFKIFKA